MESGGGADFADLKCLPLGWPVVPIEILIPSFLDIFSGKTLIAVSILMWFLIGSLVGALVGRKKRKKISSQ